MNAWAHRYSEPLLWLVGVAVVLVLSGVPRCAEASEVGGDATTSTSVTTDPGWFPSDRAPADHVHVTIFGSGGGGWTAPVPPAPTSSWLGYALTCGSVVCFAVGVLGKRRRRALPAQHVYRCRLCNETAMGSDAADAEVAHILAGACNGDMEDEPMPCTARRGASEIAEKDRRQALGGVTMEEALSRLRRAFELSEKKREELTEESRQNLRRLQ